ncbi:putative vacuolar protein sorting-associated protein [Trypanosoma rangeli]|uniref:Putative vacuolar protein sorting-associated protein n=1 Tax=Trypanosoma rangeli TaxID=5698 RepID=A0A3R7NER3_TRYRA|nr:putative vacuolar protein sorting-associated protein [Trypanosoma rangeli]RNF05411.1 putative vacuolar protein sorting-associated protein [Trypanosoma rangeli]|eukprot:RNF05411.1 putative vacuolar protein sorting-associated protein [Trypanosoma rangeli]
MSNATVPNFFSIVSEYVDHMLPEDNAMKVLLVDEVTLNIISMACSQTLLLKKRVFLVCRVDEHRQRRVMKGMHCIVFIRPQTSSVAAVAEELQAAKYGSYAIHFSNAASPELLDSLARADVDNLVNRVSEVFCDFEAHNADAFVSVVSPKVLLPAFLSAVAVHRIAESIAATFVAWRRRPYIRFEQNSAFARRVAVELGDILNKNAELYNYKNKDGLLLILDRRSDALTPLLTPWTYQAMLHEHIGLHHNRLQFSDGAVKEEYVFSQQDDPFFAANMFANWGELCSNVKAYVDTCKATLNIDRSTATMDEIKEFMQKLPQTKSLTGSVTKHATVVSHLSSIIKKRDLLAVSLLEQDMIASTNANDHWNRLQAFAAKQHSGAVDARDIFRLCLIYHLRYEKPNQPSHVATLLDGIDAHLASYLRKLRSTPVNVPPTSCLAKLV